MGSLNVSVSFSVDPGDLKAAFVTAKRNDLVSCERQGTNSTHLLSAANKSSMYNLIPRTKPIMSKQSATIDQEGEVPIEGSEERIP